MKLTYVLPCILSLNALVRVLFPALQHLVSVAVGHASKTTCSGVFLSGRTQHSVQQNELKGLSSLLVQSIVNATDESVTSTFLGLGPHLSEVLKLRVGKAKYMGPHFGCSLAMSTFNHDSEYFDFDKMKSLIRHEIDDSCDENSDSFQSDTVSSDCLNNVLDFEFGDAALETNQSRAIVVSVDGNIVAERYQDKLGIHSETKLLGWSMTKSVFSAIVGVAMQQGILTLDTPVQLRHLRQDQRDEIIEQNGGKPITFRHLLHMYDILGFIEDYSIMQDVVFMLYGTHETVKFASSRPRYADTNRVPISGWYYSSAVSNLLSEEFRHLFESDSDYWEFPFKNLFGRINATSFAMEMDAKGTFVASSFAYATARDWTKLGELLRNNGKYNGEQLLPNDYIDFAIRGHPQSSHYYGGQMWLNPKGGLDSDTDPLPKEHPVRKKNDWLIDVMPSDTFFMSGHDGQNVFIVPSQKLVVTRLGFTQESSENHANRLMSSIMTCLL